MALVWLAAKTAGAAACKRVGLAGKAASMSGLATAVQPSDGNPTAGEQATKHCRKAREVVWPRPAASHIGQRTVLVRAGRRHRHPAQEEELLQGLSG